MLKKIVGGICISFILLLLLTGNIFAAEGNWSSDTSTPVLTDKTYTISTPQNLAWVAAQVNGGNTFSGYTLDVTADLDLSGHFWTPIGSYTTSSNKKPFCGILNGSRHKITGLKIGTVETPETTLKYAGLFGYVNSAQIHDLGLEDVAIYVKTSSAYLGGMAGSIEGAATFSRCYSQGIVSGGTAIKSGGAYSTGGFAGQLQGTASALIKFTNCYAVGSVKGGFWGNSATGGFIGSAGMGNFQNCYARCLVIGGATGNVGGFAGYTSASVYANIYAAGSVNAGNAKGFFGAVNGTKVFVSNCLRPVSTSDGSSLTITKSQAEMQNVDFAALLNSNKAGMAVTDKILQSITSPGNIIGLANGSPKTAADLMLPPTVILATDQGKVSANVTWNVAAANYDPSRISYQSFNVTGTVTLPGGVINPGSVSLTTSISLAVNGLSTSDKVLQSIMSPAAITGLANQTAKTAVASGLPSTVILVTLENTTEVKVTANVTWDIDSALYDPSLTSAQTFSVNGEVTLPSGVVNTGAVPLATSINVTVDAAKDPGLAGWELVGDKNGGYTKLVGVGDFDTLYNPLAADVTVSGTLKRDFKLSAAYDYLDSNGLPENGSTYQWYRAADASGAAAQAIAEATKLEYTLTSDDIGKYICFAVTPSNGTTTGNTVQSSYTNAIAEADFTSGLGTAESPYHIANIQQLKKVKDYPGAYFILDTDIDGMNEIVCNTFTGDFNGNGHTVTLSISDSTNSNVGMFGLIGFNTTRAVYNLNLEGSVTGTAGSQSIGALAGANSGIVRDCHSSVSVTGGGSETGWLDVGGLVGDNSGSITNCDTTGTVSGTMTGTASASTVEFGGLAGYNNGTISGSSSSSDVTVGLSACHSSSVVLIGGLVGNDDYSGEVTGCYASGHVTGSSTSGAVYAGGIAGQHGSPPFAESVTTSYFAGSVSGTNTGGNVYAGGLVGYFPYGSVTNCYNAGNVTGTGGSSGNVYVGGLIGCGRANNLSASYSCGTSTATGGSDINNGGIFGKTTNGYTASCYWNSVSNTAANGSGNRSSAEMTGTAASSGMSGLDYNTYFLTKANDVDYWYYPQLKVFADSADDAVKAASLASVQVSAITLESIAVTTPPIKTTYNIGEALDLSGLVVTGTYSDNSTAPVTITMDNISGFDNSVVADDQIITVTYEGKITTFTADIVATLQSISTPDSITGVVNGTVKTAEALGLPAAVIIVTDQGNMSADVTWDVASSTYDPDVTTEQIFTVGGTVALPSGVVNPNSVLLDVSIDVTVNAAAPTDKNLTSVTAPDDISGVANGTEKSALALGLPSTVTLVTNDGNVQADVTWDVAKSSYDPADTVEQTFEVEGEVTLPDGVINPDSVDLTVTVEVTVNEAASTDKTLLSVTVPDDITGVANGTAKTASALGLPGTVTLVTSGGNVQADVEWDVDGCDYDPSDTAEQTFTVNGTVTLPSGVVNTNGVSLDVSISVSVNAAASTNKTLLSITPPTDVTGVANGTAKTASALGLPGTVTLVTSGGNVQADVTWDVAESSYDASVTTEQTFAVNGAVTLPSGVVNTNGVSLDVSISVTVNAATSKDKTLVSVTTPTAVTFVANGTAKTASALGLPGTVTLVTSGGNVQANVTWDVAESSYDPSVTTEQTFTVDGTVTLPAGVINPDNVLLSTSISVTVNAGSNGGGGNNGGGGGGGAPSTPSTPSTPLTPDYKADVDAGNGSHTTLPVTVDKSSGSAVVDVGTGSDLMSGGKTTVVTVPSVPDVDTYTLGIPVPDLTTPDEQGEIAFKTDNGSVTVPSNMLTSVEGISGNKAQISIGQGDKSNLSTDIKAAIGDRPLVQLRLSIDGKQTDWNNANAPVTVSIPYTPTEDELKNPESIIIWYIDGSGNVVTIPNGHYDPATGMVTFDTTHFSDYAVAYNKVSFNDVATGAWYNKAVSFIAARGITGGTGNGNYSPEAKLTRGEFLVMLMKAYGIAPDTNSTDNFSDAGNTYYTGYLAAAKRLGISGGVGNNMYAPDREITRQEMFTLVYNILKAIGQLPGRMGEQSAGLTTSPQGDSDKSLSSFSDAGRVASWAKDAMTLLVETGTIGGNNGMLTATSATTRAEMAQVVYNLLAK